MGALKNSVATKCGISLGSALFDETKTDVLARSSFSQNIFCRKSLKSVKNLFLYIFSIQSMIDSSELLTKENLTVTCVQSDQHLCY